MLLEAVISGAWICTRQLLLGENGVRFLLFVCHVGVLGWFFYIQFHLTTLLTLKQAVKTFTLPTKKKIRFNIC